MVSRLGAWQWSAGADGRGRRLALVGGGRRRALVVDSGCGGGGDPVDESAPGVLEALRLAGEAEMLEMGEGLAFGHDPPNRLSEQVMRELGDRCRTESQ